MTRPFTLRLATGATHPLDLDAPAISVGLEAESADQLEGDYPRFELRSHDDAYVEELGAADSARTVDDQLVVRFEGLLPDRRYTLRMFLDAEIIQPIFEEQPLASVVDQPREEHQRTLERGFTEWAIGEGGELPPEVAA